MLFFSMAGSKGLFLSLTHLLCCFIFFRWKWCTTQIYKTILKNTHSILLLNWVTWYFKPVNWLLIQDNQRTGEQFVRRPWQPNSKLHLWAYSGANTESSLMRTRAICSRPLNSVYMDVGCWFLQPPAFVFTGQSRDSSHTLLSGPFARVVEMYQPFKDLEPN